MKISFYTLGCKVNQYETEMLKERFLAKGHEIVGEEDYADAYVINTCTVTSLADRKSRQYIRRMKNKNQNAVIAVTGCYAQIKPEEVSSIEGVDIVTGTNEKGKIVELVEEKVGTESIRHNLPICIVHPGEELTEYEETGTITSMESRTRAYIKVQEGCNRFCSYCIIPYARGEVRSRAPKAVIEEAKSLINFGFKEIILTGINTALYGTEKDFCEKYGDDRGIELLINELNDIPGDFRIRLSSLEPTVINKDYVKGLLKYDKLCHHLHLSIQSGSNNVLKAMNRRYSREEYLDIVKELKNFDQGYGITTDIIVGFPGETDEDFKDSITVTELGGFCKIHPFKYSRRSGTKAAEMTNQISGEVKKCRINALIKKGNEISEQFFLSCIGRKERVLTEEYLEDERLVTGYSGNYIKTYILMDENESIAKDTFVDVVLEKPYRDGMLGKVI